MKRVELIGGPRDGEIIMVDEKAHRIKFCATRPTICEGQLTISQPRQITYVEASDNPYEFRHEP
jgi:hypothetical protein